MATAANLEPAASIGGKYVLKPRRLNDKLYTAQNKITAENVIIKAESIAAKRQTLKFEYQVMQILHRGVQCFDGFQNIKHIQDDNVIYTTYGYIRTQFDHHIPQN